MKVILGYTRYGVEIDVKENASRDDMINAYLGTYGGPQEALNHFLKHVSFIEDTIPDATIIDNDDDRTSSKEDSN